MVREVASSLALRFEDLQRRPAGRWTVFPSEGKRERAVLFINLSPVSAEAGRLSDAWIPGTVFSVPLEDCSVVDVGYLISTPGLGGHIRNSNGVWT